MLEKSRIREIVDPNIHGILDKVSIRACFRVSKAWHKEVVPNTSLDVLNMVIWDLLYNNIIHMNKKVSEMEGKMAGGKMKREAKTAGGE